MFSWLSILSGVLKLANMIAGLMKDRQLLDAGEARGVAKSLASIMTSLDIAKDVEAEVAAMSDAEVDKALEGDFRD